MCYFCPAVLAQVITSRQCADWRELRFESFDSPKVAKTLAQLAVQIRDALERTQEIENRSQTENEELEAEGTKSLRRFVYDKITAQRLLYLDHSMNPYRVLSDPTDPYPGEYTTKVSICLWFPGTQYLRSAQLQPFTPVAAICTLDPMRTIDALREYLQPLSLINQLALPVGKMRNEEKERIFTAMATALSDCFIVAVTITDLILGVGRSNLEMAYQAIINIFLLPLLTCHKSLHIEKLNIYLCSVGEKNDILIRFVKKAVRISYPKSGTTSVDFVRNKDDWILLSHMTRIIAWAIGSFHNSGNQKWISLLEQKFQSSDKDSSHLEESLSD